MTKEYSSLAPLIGPFNCGVTPKWNSGIHSSHDLGMAFDLGVSNYIDRKLAQKTLTDNGNTAQMKAALDAAMQAQTQGWSVANAASYSGLLVNETDPASLNKQTFALRDFLSLYALTQSDGQAGLNGHIVNTSAAKLFGGIISGVHIGDAAVTKDGIVTKPLDANPYPSINAILDKLGLEASPVDGHENHFHIYLKVPTLQALPKNLEANTATAGTTEVAPAADPRALVDYVPTLIIGEELMFTMDVPNAPPQEAPIVLVQAATPAADATPQPDYILKDCTETQSMGDPRAAWRSVDPAGMLAIYLQNHANRTVDQEMLAAIRTTLLQGTTHGNLVSGTSTSGRTAYRYDPTPDYEGDDHAVFLAEFEGKVYKIEVVIKVLYVIDQNSSQCDDPRLIKVNKPRSELHLDGVTVTFADVPGAALGSTTDTSITLSNNAAGHGWFIDPTPGDNSEFLPTSNPNEWIAKEGSAAYGKMDLLSVLLHEYGHVLGIEHSADAHDYMATTLQPGVRRTLTVDQQLELMALAGYFPVPDSPSEPYGPRDPGAPLPFTRTANSRFARRPRASADDLSQFATLANAKLENPDFTDGAGWATQGDVAFAAGSATLSETGTAQTRLNQVFVVGEQDRFLSFTLAGDALGDQTGGPDDAFEVALLDANTGAALLGGNGLSKSDAFLNLQANGAERASSAVTRIANADGSRTYLVDLAGVAAGTVVNLSFDLIA